MNKVILVGNLGRDAETKFTPGGAARTLFSIATGRRWKDQATGEWKEETDWHNVVLWRSEGLANYLQKGKQVYVEGRLKTRNYEDKDGKKIYITEVVADEVILLGGRGDSGGDSGGSEGSYEEPSYSYPSRSGGGQTFSNQPSRAPTREEPADAGSPFQPEISDDDVPF